MNVIDAVRDTAGRTRRFVIAAALSLGVLAAQSPDASAAEDKKLLLWMDNSFSVLYGAGFEIDDGDQWDDVLFEHVSGWSFGDLYMFFEHTRFRNPTGDDDTSWYGEISPRLSLGKILGKDFSFSIFGQDYSAPPKLAERKSTNFGTFSLGFWLVSVRRIASCHRGTVDAWCRERCHRLVKAIEMNVIDAVRDTAGRTRRFVIAAALSLGVLAAQSPPRSTSGFPPRKFRLCIFTANRVMSIP